MKAERIELLTLDDPNGSQIRVSEFIYTPWSKKLVITSRTDGQNWGSSVYVVSPEEKSCIADWLRSGVGMVETELSEYPDDPNTFAVPIDSLDACDWKGVYDLRLRVTGTRQIEFCSYCILSDSQILVALADFLDNYDPSFS